MLPIVPLTPIGIAGDPPIALDPLAHGDHDAGAAVVAVVLVVASDHSCGFAVGDGDHGGKTFLVFEGQLDLEVN